MLELQLPLHFDAATDDWDHACQAALKELHTTTAVGTITLDEPTGCILLTVADAAPVYFKCRTTYQHFQQVVGSWVLNSHWGFELTPKVQVSKTPSGKVVYFLYLIIKFNTDNQSGLFLSMARILEFASGLTAEQVQYFHGVAQHLEQTGIPNE